MTSMSRFAVLILCATLVGAGASASAVRETPAQLLKETAITERQATAAALAKVPHGLVKSSELEREHGRLIWSFDIATPASTVITEVNVDAKTGKVVAVHKETPADERKEALADKTLK